MYDCVQKHVHAYNHTHHRKRTSYVLLDLLQLTHDPRQITIVCLQLRGAPEGDGTQSSLIHHRPLPLRREEAMADCVAVQSISLGMGVGEEVYACPSKGAVVRTRSLLYCRYTTLL